MDWGDRQRFLRAVGPLRLFAVIGGITGTVGLFGLLGSSVSRAIRFSDFTLLARAIVQGAAYVALVYTQWLHWRLAGAIAATAGGTTPKMQDWSEVQLRLIWVAVMYLVLYLLEWTVEWGIFFLNRVNSL